MPSSSLQSGILLKLWQLRTRLRHRPTPPPLPRIAQRQTHRSNIPASTPFEYWRSNLFLPLIDHLINQLQDRLCKPSPRLKAQYLMPTRLYQLTDDIWRDIKTNMVICYHQLTLLMLSWRCGSILQSL